MILEEKEVATIEILVAQTFVAPKLGQVFKNPFWARGVVMDFQFFYSYIVGKV